MLGALLTLSFTAPDMTGTFTTAINSVKSDVFSYAGIALPVALGIVGLFIAVRLDIKFFKGTVK